MVILMSRYDELSQKEKQLLATQYPYKKDQDIFNKAGHGGDIIGTQNELDEFKRRAEEDGVSLMKRKNFTITKDGPTSLIDVALGDLPEDSYRAALELAKIEFEPVGILQELFAIEATRLRRGLAFEEQLGLGLEQDTQAAMTSLTNITKSIHDITEGQKLTVEFENNLSSMIEAMDFDEDERIQNEVIDADFTEIYNEQGDNDAE